MMFDSVAQWLSRRTIKGLKISDGYLTPPMPFSLSPDEAVALAGRIPGVRAAHDLAQVPGRGLWKLVA